MEFKADGDMSLYKYWKKHRISIAKDRHWAIQEGDQYSFETCTTLRQYDDYIKKVAGYLGQYRTTATIRITGRPFCKNQLGRPCFCSQVRTNSSCQAGPVSQDQIR